MPPSHPFIHVRTQENRTPTGRRTSTPARRAALYYAFGRDKEAQLEGRQRGEWLGPDGRTRTQEEVMAWVRDGAMNSRYTFQGILSVPEGDLTAAEFNRAMRQGVQIKDWRLIAHDDTKHRHAHVLWFGDKRLEKKTFLAWQAEVRAELVRLEEQLTNGRAAEQESGLEMGQSRAKGQEVSFGW